MIIYTLTNTNIQHFVFINKIKKINTGFFISKGVACYIPTKNKKYFH